MKTAGGKMNLYYIGIIAVFSNVVFPVYTYGTAVKLESRMDGSEIVISCLIPKAIYSGSYRLNWMFKSNQGIITTCRPNMKIPCLVPSVKSTGWANRHKFKVIPGGASLRINEFINRTEDEQFTCGFYHGSDFSTEISFSVKFLYNTLQAGDNGESTISTPYSITTSQDSVEETTEYTSTIDNNISRNSNIATPVLVIPSAIFVCAIIGIAVFICWLYKRRNKGSGIHSVLAKWFLGENVHPGSANPQVTTSESCTPALRSQKPDENPPVPSKSVSKQFTDGPTPWNLASKPQENHPSSSESAFTSEKPQENHPEPSKSGSANPQVTTSESCTPVSKQFTDGPTPWNSASKPQENHPSSSESAFTSEKPQENHPEPSKSGSANPQVTTSESCTPALRSQKPDENPPVPSKSVSKQFTDGPTPWNSALKPQENHPSSSESEDTTPEPQENKPPPSKSAAKPKESHPSTSESATPKTHFGSPAPWNSEKAKTKKITPVPFNTGNLKNNGNTDTYRINPEKQPRDIARETTKDEFNSSIKLGKCDNIDIDSTVNKKRIMQDTQDDNGDVDNLNISHNEEDEQRQNEVNLLQTEKEEGSTDDDDINKEDTSPLMGPYTNIFHSKRNPCME